MSTYPRSTAALPLKAPTIGEAEPPRVAELMTRTIEIAHLHEPLAVAADRMAAAGIAALPVVDGDELVGLISAHDIDRRAHAGMDLETITIGEVMAPGVLHCLEHDDPSAVAATMAAVGIPYLPVLDAGKQLVGIVARDRLPPPEGAGAARFSPASGDAAAEEPHPGLKVYAEKPTLKD